MNKKELRDKFFKEHTYKCENGISRVCTHPHNLFEWMYEQLTLTDVVSTFFCEDEDLKYSSKKCKEQCDSCKWIENI